MRKIVHTGSLKGRLKCNSEVTPELLIGGGVCQKQRCVPVMLHSKIGQLHVQKPNGMPFETNIKYKCYKFCLRGGHIDSIMNEL